MAASEEELAEYFHSNPAWKRLLLQLRAKWETYGRAAGVVSLKDSTREERKAIGSLMGRSFTEQEIRFSVRDFLTALEESRYAGADFHTLLECYFCEPITTRAEKNEAKKSGKELFYQTLDAHYSGCMQEWIDGMIENQQFGYKNMEQIRKAIPQEEALSKAKGILDKAAAARLCLQNRQNEEEKIPLAVLAANVSDDPHFLDRGSLAGTFFLNLLCFETQTPYPSTALEWKQLLLSVGIQPDEVSSTVMTYGLHLRCADGLHQGVEAFYLMREPLIISTWNLQSVESAYSDNGKVYVIENEMVFADLVKKARQSTTFRGALICTSGQLRTAGWELLKLLADGGAGICYSGDLDPEGMDIADRIWKKWPEKVTLLCMGPEDYLKSMSGCRLSEPRITKLDHLKNPILKQTAELVRREKCAGYQENILGLLEAEILGK